MPLGIGVGVGVGIRCSSEVKKQIANDYWLDQNTNIFTNQLGVPYELVKITH